MSRELEIVTMAKQRELLEQAQIASQLSPIPPFSLLSYFLRTFLSVPLGAPPYSGQPSPIPVQTMNGIYVQPVQLSPLPSQEVQRYSTADMVHAVHAIRCFTMTLSLTPGSRLENTLRLLQLWFQYGECDEVYKLLRENIKGLPVETWLEVIPQLMARLDSSERMSSLVKQVIYELLKSKPQVTLYSLIFRT